MVSLTQSHSAMTTHSAITLRFLVILLAVLTIALAGRADAAVPPPLYTAAPSYQPEDRYVATSVFHWYTANGGQLSGPWRPLEGRPNWTGEPEWWRGQIKQMMSANIDVLYVHLMTQTEAQRVNLFKALAQLRAEGYDTPKVAPFLDPMVIWHEQPLVNLATEPGKNEFVGHYVRFFDQYFSANTDQHATDYLARQDGKPILNTWHVKFNLSNLASLTRADVSNRLAAAHSVFTNDFVMVTTALNPPTLSFADEQVPQFEVNQYYRAVTFNGLQSVQLKGGYWDQNVRNPGSFLARAGGTHYRDAWNQVDRDTTRRIYIESWNEYDEGTGIYAADTVQPPYVAPANTGGNMDTWSATGDPFEYIKTTATGAAAFNDIPALGSTILWHNFPATLIPGETRTATVIIRNTGDESWSAAKGFRLGQTDAGPAFVANKRVLLDNTQDEIPVYGGIFRGRPKVFTVNLTAPATPGHYTTHWRMQRDGTGAFGAELTVPMEVKVKAAGTVTLGNLAQVADGTARQVSATTTPPGLNVALTYNGSPYPPTSAGTHVVSATIDDPNFHGQAGSLLIVTEDVNLLAGVGGFEGQSLGSMVTSPPDVVDASTIPGWRVFNVDSANASFTASIIANASAGSRAIRLAVNNTGGTASYALDQWAPSMHTPVTVGSVYTVAFDAAWIAGLTANNLLFHVQEFDAAGGFLGNGLAAVRSVATTGYQTHQFIYRPVNAATAGIGLFFGPLRGGVGTTTLSIDNIQLHVAPPLPDGGFEFSSIGTTAGGPGAFVNTTTFPGWRLFSVGSPPIASLTGEIVDAGGFNGGSPGRRALRLDIENTGTPAAHDYGLDNNNARSPVVPGKTYTLSYDAALVAVAGSLTLNVSIAEFDSAGSFTGTQGGFTPTLTADQTFRRHTHEYVIANPNTTQVVIAFRPVTTGGGTLVLDNVRFTPFVANTPPHVSSAVNGASFELGWPESHLGWRAQFNTENIADPAAWKDIPGSETAHQFNLPISPALPAVYLRLVRP